MMWIWIALCVWMAAFVVVEFTVNTEKAEPIDISDPDGEDKWGAM